VQRDFGRSSWDGVDRGVGSDAGAVRVRHLSVWTCGPSLPRPMRVPTEPSTLLHCTLHCLLGSYPSALHRLRGGPTRRDPCWTPRQARSGEGFSPQHPLLTRRGGIELRPCNSEGTFDSLTAPGKVLYLRCYEQSPLSDGGLCRVGGRLGVRALYASATGARQGTPRS
jgi:hypothetical protein